MKCSSPWAQPTASALSIGISEPFLILSDVPVTATDASAASTLILVTGVTTFLADVANTFATMAAMFNDYVIAPYYDPLTDFYGLRRGDRPGGQHRAVAGGRRCHNLGSESRLRHPARHDRQCRRFDGEGGQRARVRGGPAAAAHRQLDRHGVLDAILDQRVAHWR